LGMNERVSWSLCRMEMNARICRANVCDCHSKTKK